MEINLSLGFISFLGSGILFLCVLIVYFVGFQKGKKGRPFLFLIGATLLWSIMLTLSQVEASTAFSIAAVSELLRYFTWFYVLQSASGLYSDQKLALKLSNPFSPLNIAIMLCIAAATLIFNDALVGLFDLQNTIIIKIGWMLLFSLAGLIVVEQLYRNTPVASRGSISFLCISAGAIFIYDFFVFSNALLAGVIDYEFWSARGIVNVLIIPTLLIAAARNPALAPSIHVSRQFLLHSTTLFGAGIYLIVMSVIGYYVKQAGGEWGKILQATFMFATSLFLVVLFFSNSIKARIKRYLSYSFRNKYDYREEWNRFSRTLLTHDPEASLYSRALQAIGQIVDSEGGSLWIRDNHKYIHKTDWQNSSAPREPEPDDSELILRLHEKRRLISKDEFVKGRETSLTRNGAEAHWFANIEKGWLIVPLWANEVLFGFVYLGNSSLDATLDMEDKDLLNTVAHHVSLSLFLKEMDTALQQARQFADMNQMTAFLMHDLKTVLSQLSLLVENAATHKRNPDFIDDMVATVEHATRKMQRVMQLLRNPDQIVCIEPVPILNVLEKIDESFRHSNIHPKIVNHGKINPSIKANLDQLYSSVKNIVQNAVESCDRNGKVDIELKPVTNNQLSIVVSDNGKGMSQEFIRERLFRPFDSTKGVSGMGIGVYQSREYFRSIGGELDVTSEEGIGSQFTILLPVEV